MKRSVQVEEALGGLNWGNFCLFISISTGGLNIRGLAGLVVICPSSRCYRIKASQAIKT